MALNLYFILNFCSLAFKVLFHFSWKRSLFFYPFHLLVILYFIQWMGVIWCGYHIGFSFHCRLLVCTPAVLISCSAHLCSAAAYSTFPIFSIYFSTAGCPCRFRRFIFCLYRTYRTDMHSTTDIVKGACFSKKMKL